MTITGDQQVTLCVIWAIYIFGTAFASHAIFFLFDRFMR